MIEKENHCIIVLGMHRSGTSALTGLLHLLGAHTGELLLPPKEDNAKGFWEHAQIVSLHDQLLELLNSSWDDEAYLPNQWWKLPELSELRNQLISVLRRDFSGQRLWLIKDPRMCRLLPLWLEILRELNCRPMFILALRNPSEVASSLLRRNNLGRESSCLLWTTHMLDAELYSREYPRAFVIYDDLLEDWRDVLAKLSHSLGYPLTSTLDDASRDIDNFLDPSLRHHDCFAALPDHPACLIAQDSFKLLSTKNPDRQELDQLRARTLELASVVMPWSKQLRICESQKRDFANQNRQLESKLAKSQAEIIRVKATVSWRVTKPLRFIWNTLPKK